jgi:opacity protein-like surface antigen
MMRLLRLLLAIMAGALTFSAAAYGQSEDPHGWYSPVSIGVSRINDTEVTFYDAGGTFGGTGAEDTFDTTFDFGDALALNGVVGYDFGSLRAEVEVSYEQVDLRALTLDLLNGQEITLSDQQRAGVCQYLLAPTCGGTGNTFIVEESRVRQLTGMANVWFDLPVGPVVPYVGGGVGIAAVELAGEGMASFAWQLGAGAAVQISPKIALTVDYRHRQVSGKSVEYDDRSGFRFDRLKTDTLTVGVRIYFGKAKKK